MEKNNFVRTGGYNTKDNKINTPNEPNSFSSDSDSNSSSDSENGVNSFGDEVQNPKYAPPTNEMEAVISFLMRTDFKKHVDLVEFAELPGFHLTEDEESMDFAVHQIMKIIKIMLV